MPREETLGEIKETAARVEMHVMELISRLTQRQAPEDAEVAKIVSELLTYLRSEDARREQAYALLEERVEHITGSVREFMICMDERKDLGRELVEQRACTMSLRRENFQLQAKLEAKLEKLHNQQVKLEESRRALKAFRESLGEAAETLGTAAEAATSIVNSRIVNASRLLGSKLVSTAQRAAAAGILAQQRIAVLGMKTDELARGLDEHVTDGVDRESQSPSD
jgi:chromosome segregation ATPase